MKRFLMLSAAVLALVGCVEYSLPPIASDANHASATPEFTGTGIAIPLLANNVPAHPFLAAPGRNGMHADSYASHFHPYSGPMKSQPVVKSAKVGKLFGGECATVVFDRQGRLYTFCSTLVDMSLYALDAETLHVLAKKTLPLRDSNKSLNIKAIMGDTSGGAYFHLDQDDRPIIATADKKIQIFELQGTGSNLEWVVVKQYDILPALSTSSRVTDAIPDWQGNLWFITREGIVGAIDKTTGAIRTTALSGEEIQNSLAVAADGVYIVSNFAMYRFELDAAGVPTPVWRKEYDRGSVAKPGQLDQGSGTTPVLLDYNGHRWLAIGDNADSQINAVVFNRDNGDVICKVPLFEPGQSATDNAFIGYRNSIVVENNYGYQGPLADNWTTPGVSRIDIDPDGSPGQPCTTRWTSPQASQTTVHKLSANGLVYLYTREPIPGKPATAQAYYLTTISFETGELVRKVLTGTGANYNNNYAPITIGPGGKAYVGVLAGIISVGDR